MALVANLHNLATALSDQRWLDMGTVEEEIERVRVCRLTIYRTHEEAIIEQAWCQRERLERAEYALHIDELLWLRPTQIELLDVHPRRPIAIEESELDIAQTIFGVMLRRTANEPFLVENPSGDRRGLLPRQACMWLLYEIAGLTAEEICERMKYKSVQPMVSLRSRVIWRSGTAYNQALFEMVRACGREVDLAFGEEMRRDGLDAKECLL